MLLAIWSSIVAFLALKGVFVEKPHFLAIVLVGTTLICLTIIQLLKNRRFNIKTLLLIHILRIPVEFILYELFISNQLPIIMTFKGYNFDILIGFCALLILIGLKFFDQVKLKSITRIWSVFGVISLSSVLLMGILSSPIPIQQFAFDQPNVAVLYFPFVLLPTLLVPIVFMSHIFIWRMMSSSRSNLAR